jgi:Ca2+-binding RTX toxin-like protein
MALLAQVKTDLYRFFAIAFDAAPGVTYMTQLADAVAADMSVEQIVEVFTTKPQFTATYPTFLTNRDFAVKLVDNVVGGSASAAAKAEAVADIEAALNANLSRGKVVYNVFNNLANLGNDAKWGGTAALLANQVAYAQYYTEVLLGDTTNLATLRSVISGVTPTTDITPAAINAVLNPPPVVVQPSYALSANAAAADEGSSVLFTLTTANVAAGSTFTYTLGGVNASDVVGGSLSGVATVGNDGKAIIQVNLAADATTDGAKTLTVAVAGQTAAVAVNDTSLAPVVQPPATYALAANAASVDEGTSVLFTLTTANVAAGSAFTYTLGGVNASDVVGGSLTGVATVGSDGKAVIQVNLAADGVTDGAKTLTVSVAGQTAGVAVSDTSLAPVTPVQDTFIISATDIVNANNTNAGIVSVLVGDTGNKSVTLSTDAITPTNKFIVSGNANIALTAGLSNDVITVVSDGAGSISSGQGNDTVELVGTGNSTVDAGAGNDTVRVFGSGNNTINAGAGNDTVVINGGGNNVINVGAGNDNVTGGTGSDSIVFGAGELTGADAVDAGTGADTVTISGNGNVITAGNLVGVENLVLSGTTVSVDETVLEAYVADGLLGISGNAATSVITITGAAGSTADLAGLSLTGIKTLTVDAAGGGNVRVVLSAEQIAAVGSITAVAGSAVTVQTTVAGYGALGSKAAGGTVAIVDTAENIVNAGASLSGLNVTLNGAVSVAAANTLIASGSTVTYELSDTAANLALAARSVFDNAVSVTATTTANASQAREIALTIDASNGVRVDDLDASTVTLNVADGAGVLTNAFFLDWGVNEDSLVPGSTVTAAQAVSLYAKNDAASYAIVDTAANVAAEVGAGDAALNAARSITLTGAGTVADVAAINFALTAPGGLSTVAAGYALTDNLAALQGNAAVVGAAGNVTVNGGAQTVLTAQQAEALTNTGTTSYTVSDSIENLLAASSAVVAGATAASTTTGTLTASQANGLVTKFGATKVSDANIVITGTVSELLTLSAAAVGEAQAVGGITISAGTATVQQAVDLKAIAGAKLGAYAVNDTVAAISAGVAVAGTLTVLNNASSVSVSDAATVAQITAANTALNGAAGGLASVSGGYTLTDSQANLLAGGATPAVVAAASKINVTGTVTVAQAQAIDAANGAAALGTDITYALRDSFANLSGAVAPGGIVDNATSANITDASLSYANAGTYRGMATLTTIGAYAISDNVANLPAAADATTNGATSVTLVDSANSLFPAGVAVAEVGYAGTVTVSDNQADITALSAANKADLDRIVITDEQNIGSAAAVNALAALKPTTYSVGDTYTNLTSVGAGVATMVGAAATVTPSAALNVSQYNTLDALAAGNVVASIVDSATNLASAGGAAAITAAQANFAGFATTATLNATVAANASQASTLAARGLAPVELGKLVVTDTSANLEATAAAVLTAANTVTSSDNGMATFSVAAAAKIFGANGAAYGNYHLSDTAANLAGANANLLKNSLSVTATTAATVGEANTLAARTSMGSITFDVTGTAADLAAGANDAGTNAARNLTVTAATPAATVAQAQAIVDATNTGTNTYSISDDAGNILLGAAATINGAVNLTATDGVSVAQANSLDAYTNTGTTSLASITDSAANLAGASGAVLSLAGGVVTANTNATMAQAVNLAAFTKAVVFNVSDTAANISAQIATGALNEAVIVTATGNATVAQAQAIVDATNTGATNYDISDTVANVVAAATATRNGAIDLTATGAATAAQGKVIDAATNTGTTTFSITDSWANILADGVAGAASVTVTDSALTVAQVNAVGAGAGWTYAIADNDANLNAAIDANNAALVAATSVKGSQGANVTIVDLDKGPGVELAIAGTRAEIAALSSTLKAATGVDPDVAYTVTLADLVATPDYFATLGTSEPNSVFVVRDTAANLASGNALLNLAASVEATTAATVAQATTIEALVTTYGESYSINDTATAVAGAGAGVLNGATNIVATGSATVAEATTIDAATNSGTTSYSISGTAAAVAGAAPAVRNGATNVTATGTATNAEAVTILGATNAGATTIAKVAATALQLTTLAGALNAGETITAAEITGIPATVVQAAAIAAKASLQAGYNLEDTAASLSGAASSILNGAAAITATTDATVSRAATIDAATNTGANSYQIVDTAANVLAASAALLGTDATIVVNDTSMSAATATQLAALDAANNGVAGGPNFTIAGGGAVGVFTLSDSFANLTATANAGVVAAATNLTATGTLTVAQANTLRTAAAAPGEPTYSLSDTYANLATGGATTTDAVNLTVTNNVTAAQAVNVVNTLGGAGSEVYVIRDTAAGIATVAAANGAVVTGATSVTATSAASVAQAGFLSELGNLTGGYTITDTAANVVAALGTANAANAADRGSVFSATSVTISGNASVAQALGVTGADRGLYTLGSKVTYAVQDAAAAIITGLNGIDAAGLSAATGISLATTGGLTVNQGVTLTALANFRGYDQDGNPATAGTYDIVDTAAAVQTADGTLINNALSVTATGTAGADVIDFSAFGRGVTLSAGNGADNVFGTSSADTLNGDADGDFLSAGAGADAIDGGAGNDTLVGEAGADSLTGGAGDDIFSFSGGDTGLTFATRDVITDLGATDVIRTVAGGGAATYAAQDGAALDFNAFVAAANVALDGAVRIFAAYNFNNSGNALVAIDVDGDGTFNVNDLLIELTGVNLAAEVGAGNFGGP